MPITFHVGRKLETAGPGHGVEGSIEITAELQFVGLAGRAQARHVQGDVAVDAKSHLQLRHVHEQEALGADVVDGYQLAPGLPLGQLEVGQAHVQACLQIAVEHPLQAAGQQQRAVHSLEDIDIAGRDLTDRRRQVFFRQGRDQGHPRAERQGAFVAARFRHQPPNHGQQARRQVAGGDVRQIRHGNGKDRFRQGNLGRPLQHLLELAGRARVADQVRNLERIGLDQGNGLAAVQEDRPFAADAQLVDPHLAAQTAGADPQIGEAQFVDALKSTDQRQFGDIDLAGNRESQFRGGVGFEGQGTDGLEFLLVEPRHGRKRRLQQRPTFRRALDGAAQGQFVQPQKRQTEGLVPVDRGGRTHGQPERLSARGLFDVDAAIEGQGMPRKGQDQVACHADAQPDLARGLALDIGDRRALDQERRRAKGQHLVDAGQIDGRQVGLQINRGDGLFQGITAQPAAGAARPGCQNDGRQNPGDLQGVFLDSDEGQGLCQGTVGLGFDDEARAQTLGRRQGAAARHQFQGRRDTVRIGGVFRIRVLVAGHVDQSPPDQLGVVQRRAAHTGNEVGGIHAFRHQGDEGFLILFEIEHGQGRLGAAQLDRAGDDFRTDAGVGQGQITDPRHRGADQVLNRDVRCHRQLQTRIGLVQIDAAGQMQAVAAALDIQADTVHPCRKPQTAREAQRRNARQSDLHVAGNPGHQRDRPLVGNTLDAQRGIVERNHVADTRQVYGRQLGFQIDLLDQARDGLLGAVLDGAVAATAAARDQRFQRLYRQHAG